MHRSELDLEDQRAKIAVVPVSCAGYFGYPLRFVMQNKPKILCLLLFSSARIYEVKQQPKKAS